MSLACDRFPGTSGTNVINKCYAGIKHSIGKKLVTPLLACIKSDSFKCSWYAKIYLYHYLNRIVLSLFFLLSASKRHKGRTKLLMNWLLKLRLNKLMIFIIAAKGKIKTFS